MGLLVGFLVNLFIHESCSEVYQALLNIFDVGECGSVVCVDVGVCGVK